MEVLVGNDIATRFANANLFLALPLLNAPLQGSASVSDTPLITIVSNDSNYVFNENVTIQVASSTSSTPSVSILYRQGTAALTPLDPSRIRIILASPETPATTPTATLVSAAKGSNSQSLARYLGSVQGASAEIQSLVNRLSELESPSETAAALRNLTAPGFSTLATVGVAQSAAFTAPIDNRLDSLAALNAGSPAVNLGVRIESSEDAAFLRDPASRSGGSGASSWMAWTSGYGAWATQPADAAAGFGGSRSQDAGGVLGLERILGNLRIGLLAVAGEGSSSSSDPSSQVRAEHWNVGAYTSLPIGNLTLDATALWGTSELDSERTILAPGFAPATAKARFHSQDTQLGLGVSYNLMPLGSRWEISPSARLKFLHHTQDAFEESGSPFALRGSALSSNTLLSKLGLRIAYRNELSQRLTLGSDFMASWIHNFQPEGRAIEMRFASSGASGSFTSLGRDASTDSAQLALGVQAIFSKTLTLRLSGEQELGSQRNQTSSTLSIGLNF
jgi:outer membrane autotransporter protein